MKKPPLERYGAAGLLGDTPAENLAHLDAARRYLALCEAAEDRVTTSRWEPRVSAGMPDSIIMHSAKEQLRNTNARLGRPLARCLRIVCVQGHTAEEWASLEGESRKGVGLAMLRVALRELSRTWAA